MIQSLKDICIKQTAEHIVTGELITTYQKLDVHTSNLVFEQFLNLSEHPNFSENCQHVKNLLTVTTVELTAQIEFFDDNFCKMIYEQNAKELGLYNLYNLEMFHLGSESESEDDDEEGEDESKIQIDIIAVLEKMLNPESFKMLKKLEITGEEIEFLPRWVEKLAFLLPSLEIFSLICMEIEEDVVQSIYKNFPKLTELEISKAKISNLNGISKMSNLTSLNIIEIEFGKKEDLDELFELKNLKELLIDGDNSGDQKSKSMIYYIESGNCLPKLEHLGCSFCDITEEMLQKLLESHPNLKSIDLMGTPLETHAQIPGRGLKLLTMGCFKDCLYTIDDFLQKGVLAEYTEPILVKLCEILDGGIEEISRKELSKCLELMCKVISAEWELREKAAEVLERLCRDNRAKMFSFSERQLLIFTIINIFEEEKVSLDTYFFEHESIWNVLSQESILTTSSKNIDAICEYAAITFCEFFPAMTILSENLDKMSPERGRALARNTTVIDEVRIAFYHSNIREQIPSLTSIISKLYKLRDNRSEEWAEIDEQCVEAFCRAIRSYKEDLEAQSVIVRTLGEIIGWMSEGAVGKLLDYQLLDWFACFIDKLYLNHSSYQKTTVNAIYSLFSAADPGKLLPNDISTQKILLEDIRSALEGYKKVKNHGVFAGVEWILEKAQKCITKAMCKWILRTFARRQIR